MRKIRKWWNRYLGKKKVTRGGGLLERFLSFQRVAVAHKILKRYHGNGRKERIVDIGCGAYPLMLLTSSYRERYGLDKDLRMDDRVRRRLKGVPYDIQAMNPLPFEDHFADVVSLLAVFEHVPPSRLDFICAEIARILRPGGILIITTPSTWADVILRILARMRLVSGEEIEEHVTNYSTVQVVSLLQRSGFHRVGHGTFECFLNRWFSADKDQ